MSNWKKLFVVLGVVVAASAVAVACGGDDGEGGEDGAEEGDEGGEGGEGGASGGNAEIEKKYEKYNCGSSDSQCDQVICQTKDSAAGAYAGCANNPAAPAAACKDALDKVMGCIDTFIACIEGSCPDGKTLDQAKGTQCSADLQPCFTAAATSIATGMAGAGAPAGQ